MPERAVFLDRDGTLIYDAGYTYRIEDFRLLDGAPEALRLLQMLGYRLVIVTNQSGIARGRYTEADMQRFNDHMLEELRKQGVSVAGLYYCPYHPEGVGGYRCDSDLRKPAPGMFLQAGRELDLELPRSFAIGDKKSDVLAGQAAGCKTFLVRTGLAGEGEPELMVKPDWIVADLLEAARVIQELQ